MLMKKDLIAKVAEKMTTDERKYTKKEASIALDGVIGTLIDVITSGEEVKINGFGSFIIKDVAERQAMNMQTNEKCIVPAHKVVKFRVSKVLKDTVKGI